jgi:hypothetical protein
MKKWAVRTASAVAVLSVVTLATACENYPYPPRKAGGFAIVNGYRSNMPMPKLARTAREWLGEAVLSSDDLYIIGVDGHPAELLHKKFNPDCDGVKAACESYRDEQVDEIDAKLRVDEAKADDPEADTLEAIVVAARRIADVPGPKHIVVLDSGLQTSGVLPMAEPWAFKADPKAVAAPLLKDERFKNLKGVHVLFSGLGTFAAPQSRLDDADVASLERLWRGILTELGATVDVEAARLGAAPPPGLPTVAVVVKQDTSVKPTPCIRLREDQVGFLPNSPNLRDKGRARELLKPIAEQLARTGVVTTLIGTTALPDGDDHSLSKARAATVKRILVDLHVPADRIATIGVGINFAGYRDPYVDGVWSEIVAMGNRLVIVQPAGQSC